MPVKKKVIIKKKKGIIRPKVVLKKASQQPEKKATKAQVQKLVNEISSYINDLEKTTVSGYTEEYDNIQKKMIKKKFVKKRPTGYKIDHYQFRRDYTVYDSKKKANVKKTLSQMTKPQMKQLPYKQLQTIQQAMRDVERKFSDDYVKKVRLIQKLHKKLKKLDQKNNLTQTDIDKIKSMYKKNKSLLQHFKLKPQDLPTKKEQKEAKELLYKLYIKVKSS